GDVAGRRVTEVQPRLLEEPRLVPSALGIVARRSARDAADRPLRTEDEREGLDGPIDMEGRRDDEDRARRDRCEVALGDMDRFPDRVARLVLEKDARAIDARGHDDVGHRRGLASLRPTFDAVATGADDRRVRMLACEIPCGRRTRERRCGGSAVRLHAAAEDDDELGMIVERLAHARTAAISTGLCISAERYAAIATSSARSPASPSMGTRRRARIASTKSPIIRAFRSSPQPTSFARPAASSSW